MSVARTKKVTGKRSKATGRKVQFLQKPSCTTCRKARKFMERRGFQLYFRDLAKERLSASARTLSLALRPSEAYTVIELRAFAADRMRNDDEFRHVLGNNVELFSRLASIVRIPAAG